MVHTATHLHTVIPHHTVIPRHTVPLDHLPILTDHHLIPTEHLPIPTDLHLIPMDFHPIAMDHQHNPIATDLHMEFPDSHPVSLKSRAPPRSPKSPPMQLISIHHLCHHLPTPPPSLMILPTPLPHLHQTVLHHHLENQPLTVHKERSHQDHRNGSNSLHHSNRLTLHNHHHHHPHLKDQHTLMDLHHPMVHNH